MFKQSAVIPLFHAEGQSKEDFCQAVAEIGIEGLELWRVDDLPDWAEAARSAGLIIAGTVGHASISNGLNNPDEHDRIEGELRRSIDVAAEFGVPGLVAFSGERRAGQSDYDGMVECAKGLRRIANYAEEKGVNINVELLNSLVDHPRYQCDHSDWGFALCEMVDRPRVKLLFDIYHMQIMEGNVIANMTRGMKWIGHIHTAGVPGRRDIDDTQELNYIGIGKALAKLGYAGFVGHEFSPVGDKLSALKAAVDVCRASGSV